MKSALLSGTAIATALGGYANAADLAPVYKAPPAAAKPFSWTGFYVGGNIGGGWADKDWNNLTASSGARFTGHLGSLSASSVLGGVQAGYNYQMGNWLLGVEGGWTWTNLDTTLTSTDPFVGDFSATSRINWVASVVGRVGFTFDRFLAYAGGGGAWAKEKDNYVSIGNPNFGWEGSNTQSGWTALVGLEYAIDAHWSARVQYNHYDFGTGTVTLNTTDPPHASFTPTFTVETPLRIDAVVVGINYRFGG